MMSMFEIDIGPFAKAKKDADDFGHNLVICLAIEECAKNIIKTQAEYEQAVIDLDDDLAARKLIELQSYQSSIALTAYMLEEHEQIST